MTIYLDDVLQRYPRGRAIDLPVEVLTAVASRARITIGYKDWEARAARVVEQYRRQRNDDPNSNDQNHHQWM
jgi:hypothetical protein